MMDLNNLYPLMATINLSAALVGVYFGSKLYNSTKGAGDFWMFLTALITSFAMLTLFDFIRKVIFVSTDLPMRSAQDVAIAFASVFAVLSAIYAKRMFDQIFE